MKGYKKYFLKSIKEFYPGNFTEIIAQADSHYHIISQDTLFAITSKNPMDKRLDFCSYFLALIKTLDTHGETFENIRKICLEVVTGYVQPNNRLQAFFKRLLPLLIHTWPGHFLIRSLDKKVSVNSNVNGFVANIITDKAQTFGLGYGIDILECGICKLFKKHDYEKYASILCEVDEITSGLAGLKLIRKGTIANGAPKCDFRFKRKK